MILTYASEPPSSPKPSTSNPFSLKSAPNPSLPRPDACLAGNRMETKVDRFCRELNGLHPFNLGGLSIGLIRLQQGRKNLLQVARDIPNASSVHDQCAREKFLDIA